MGAFNIPNPTIGGGTAFNDIVAQLLGTLSGDRFGRASIGTDLFSQILGAETAARRRPVGIVDQLLLAKEFGTTMPLSQIGGGRLAALGGRTNPALSTLFNTLTQFAGGAAVPQTMFGPQTTMSGEPVPPTPAPTAPAFGDSRDALLALQRGDEQASQAILREQAGLPPLQMAHGGTLTVDPRRRQTQGASLAGPATIVDRQGQTAAIVGEGGQSEGIAVGPGFVPRDIRTRPEGSPATRAPVEGGLFGLLGQPRDVGFRLEELLRRQGGFSDRLTPDLALSIAQRPGDFESMTGETTDPRAVAARLLGGALTADQRFGNPLVKALALGRSPTSAQINAQEFAALPPDLRDALVGIIGPDQLAGFLFAVGQGTPAGVSNVGARQAGGVRV